MNAITYEDRAFYDLLQVFDRRMLKNALKKTYRAEVKKMREIGLRNLRSSGLKVSSDLEKGLRGYVYSRGGGFLVSVKARKANKNGKGEKGMHLTRRGVKKPILMWAEEGTPMRRTLSATAKSRKLRKAHSTGAMRGYKFLEQSEDDMYKTAEEDLANELEKSVNFYAQKYGFI